jgi:hypothetical protein
MSSNLVNGCSYQCAKWPLILFIKLSRLRSSLSAAQRELRHPRIFPIPENIPRFSRFSESFAAASRFGWKEESIQLALRLERPIISPLDRDDVTSLNGDRRDMFGKLARAAIILKTP